ncbi:MAG: hypothetical protein EXS10_02920 [Phycisphaerales bacterium]|nr:hypothetical protein [Phycisphaerales bacterium]
MKLRKLHCALLTSTLGVASLANAQQPATPAVDPTLVARISEAQALVAKEPERAEHLYNLGVLQYRAGELETAGESFRAAAERLTNTLSARSTYNRGTTRYREALETLQKAQESGATPNLEPAAAATDPQAQAIQTLEESLQQLKDSIRANPSSTENIDARANAELAHRLLKKLKEQQKQEQQQQQQDQEQKDEQKDEQKESKDQQSDSENKDGKPPDAQPKEPSEKSSKDQEGKSDKPSDQGKQEKPQEPSKPEVGDQEKQPEGKPEPKQQEKPAKAPEAKDQKEQQAAAAKETEREGMTKQEIEQLLQKIRDREQIRRAQKLASERTRTTPARKDW